MTLYGRRGALSWLGALLHDTYHRPRRLAAVIEEAQDRDLADTGNATTYCGPEHERPQAFNDFRMYFWSDQQRRGQHEAGSPA